MDRLGRDDKILTYSGVKEKENRFGKTPPRLGASVPENTREITFEKRVIQRCYHCNLVCAKYINPSSFSVENVWVKQPLSPELVCLPLAVVEICGNFGTVQTKAAVCGNHLNQHGRYLLGNKTVELIKGNLSYNFLPVEILNAVQTRGRNLIPALQKYDQGTSFSALTTEFFERFGILVRHSSVYHPQSNPVERFHRMLKRLLRVLCLDAGSEWDKHLPSNLLALRTVSQSHTPSPIHRYPIHRQSWCMGKICEPQRR
ncbi:retrovirus-related Pol polyprotein from transposon 297 [Trichonephila clavipes]|nr:retrovirus-related Pol polyprotein from transposon 297 [Trichonephila clavipes]